MQISTFVAAIVSTLLVFTLASESSSEEALLLVSKSILNNYLVQNRDIAIKYSLYNIGSSSALNVNLKDESFPKEVFTVMKGQSEMTWSRISPGSNVTHVLVVRPLVSGYFNFTSAEISYKSTVDGVEQFAVTSFPGEGGIIPLETYDRKFSSHLFDWIGFIILTLPSIGIPFMLWYQQRSKYVKSSKSN